MVAGSTLRRVDPVRIVADETRRVITPDMLVVFIKALVIQNARSPMALEAHSVRRRGFFSEVNHGVVAFKQEVIGGTVRSLWTVSSIGRSRVVVVAVRTSEHAAMRDGGSQTGDVRVW